MPEELVNYEAVEEAVDTVITLAMSADSALEDNKISIAEGVSLGIKAIGIWRIIKNFPQIKEQLLNMGALEKAEMSEKFVNKFDLRDDQLEMIIEQIFAALLGFSDLLELLNKKELE